MVMKLKFGGTEIVIQKIDGVFLFGSTGVSALLGVKTDRENVNIMELCRMIMLSKDPCSEDLERWILRKAMPKFDSNLIDEGGEESLHRRVVAYIRREHSIDLIIPGLGELQDTERRRHVAYLKGYKGGQPDLMIPMSSKQYIGLAIELKTPKGKGKLSAKQRGYLKALSHNNWETIVSNNFKEICAAIDEYFNM